MRQAPEINTELSPSPYVILVIDDDAFLRAIATQTLEGEQFHVIEAADAEQALAILNHTHVDGVLLDARMPGMDGFDLCSQLRRLEHLSDLSIFMLTGLNDPDSLNNAFERGVDDFINKPVRWDLIRNKLKVTIDKNQKHKQELEYQYEHCIEIPESAPVITLDDEGHVIQTHGVKSLPYEFSCSIEKGINFFEQIPSTKRQDAINKWQACLQTKQHTNLVLQHDSPADGYLVQLEFIPTNNQRWVRCLVNDYTDSYVAEQRLLKLVSHDTNTGLLNSRGFNDKLTQLLNNDEVVTVPRVKIENYNTVANQLDDSTLHQLVCAFARRLSQFLLHNANDTVSSMAGRLSDYDFTFALTEKDFSDDPVVMFARLLDALSKPYEIGGYSISLAVYLGFADSNDCQPNAAELMDSARIALNSGCDHGQLITKYLAEHSEKLCAKNRMEQLLHRDVCKGMLHMHYQPKVDINSMQLIGVEALLRWESEELGPVSPGIFIPLAEKTGLIEKISELVVEHVLKQISEWEESDANSVPVAINLPGNLLVDDGFVSKLLNQVKNKNIAPDKVEIEVTESVMVEAGQKLINNLNKFRAKGIKVAIDDFGTGYSSFQYLRDLPVDVLKIDMSFVKKIHEDDTAMAIAKAIIAVGHELGLKVVAEGVEQHAQLNILQSLGCDIVQGYLTGKPTSASKVLSSTTQALAGLRCVLEDK
jgi:EAL domain-containing protein (putative c-di-GMP-specific phosphodiesterase class I)/CheY-like chemotaxis protein